MIHSTRVVNSFPSATIANENSGLPIEVSLIAQLGHGAGSQLVASVSGRQAQHVSFIDELEEPSAKLGGTNFSLGDTTSLYSFVVGPKGHPFHRHAGHRIFTAISGSGGAQLRFSTATQEQIEADPQHFIDAMHFINIPADCLFTVRFSGDTWHQFWPLSKNCLHPVFFALSCHTDELGGNLSEELKAQIKANKASIPSLTEVLPAEIEKIIHSKAFQQQSVPTTTLSLDAAAGTMHRLVCDTVRSNVGIARGFLASWKGGPGYVSQSELTKVVKELTTLPEQSLLRQHLVDDGTNHEDTFSLSISGVDFSQLSASKLLEMVLEGFLLNPPTGVGRLMLIRNILVKPFGLRTSPLGCPVSSLLSDNTSCMFANQYPVIDQSINDTDTLAQVILGANDKHLKFRSCVSVAKRSNHEVEISLGTSVHFNNFFGRIYMYTIDYVHRHYVSPTMLRRAVDYMLAASEK